MEMNRLKTLRGKSIFFKKVLKVTFQDKTTKLIFTLKKKTIYFFPNIISNI